MFIIFKRIFDITFSILLLLIFSPLLILSLIMIILLDFQYPLFIQERSGLNGKSILIIKLKTMRSSGDNKQITLLGKFLRFSKIDEIPQLINVLKNDMSIIGPRPLYKEFNNYYLDKHKLRISVKPGLTGLAQVKVRDSTDWFKKFNFDTIYVKKANYNLDFYILFKTFSIVFNSIFKKNHRAIESIDYKRSFFENYCK